MTAAVDGDATAAEASAALEVRHSPIHGHGVFARRAIGKGALIGRYAGRRYSARQAAKRDWDHAVTYVFGLSDGGLIDGGQGGNATRHLNHSCAPNCAAHEVEGDGGVAQIEFHSLRRIGRGEELFIDYALQSDGLPADYPCRCGAPQCRGTLLAASAG